MTPTQAKALEALISDFGPADGVVGNKDGIDVAFPNGNVYRIGSRGGVKVLGQKLSNASPDNAQPSGVGGEGGNGAGNNTAPSSEAPADTRLDPRQPAPELLLAGTPEDELHRALTLADDRQIAADLQGQAVSAVLYSYTQGGQRITDLSWKGVHEAVRIMNTRGYGKVGIVEGSAQFEQTTTTVILDGEDVEVPAITVRVYAKDSLSGGGYYGSASQPLKTVWKKKLRPDPFAEAKALSKAQRNALRPFIPVEAIEELKALHTGEGAVQYVAGTGRPTEIEKPAALDDEKAQALLAKADDLYADYKRAEDNWTEKLPPAKFYAYKSGSWHSHSRLEDFVKFMEAQVAEAKG
jgi:hypothetical protein